MWEQTRQNMKPFKYKTQKFVLYGKHPPETKTSLYNDNLIFDSKIKHFPRLNMFRSVNIQITNLM